MILRRFVPLETGPAAAPAHNGCMDLIALHHALASLQDNGVATLAFRNAGSLNILSSPVLEDLAQALDTLAQDARIRVLVLRGTATRPLSPALISRRCGR